MGWIADLLKEVPSAARYKADLERLESEHEMLKCENSDLKLKLQTAEEEIQTFREQLSQETKEAMAKANQKARKRAEGYSVK